MSQDVDNHIVRRYGRQLLAHRQRPDALSEHSAFQFLVRGALSNRVHVAHRLLPFLQKFDEQMVKAQAQVRDFANFALRAQAGQMLHDQIIFATGLLHLAQIAADVLHNFVRVSCRGFQRSRHAARQHEHNGK